jgi:hypothetical protein
MHTLLVALKESYLTVKLADPVYGTATKCNEVAKTWEDIVYQGGVLLRPLTGKMSIKIHVLG